MLLGLLQAPCTCVQAEAQDASVKARTLVSGVMTTWAAGSVYPMADVRSALGQAGDTPPALHNSCTDDLFQRLPH